MTHRTDNLWAAYRIYCRRGLIRLWHSKRYVKLTLGGTTAKLNADQTRTLIGHLIGELSRLQQREDERDAA